MKQLALLTPDEMRNCEKEVIESGTSSFQLMQRAGKQIAAVVAAQYAKREVVVLCGEGNNGGDGYIAAQHLRELGFSVRVLALGEPKTSEALQARTAFGRSDSYSKSLLKGAELIVDAMFGTGLNKALEGIYFEAVTAVNEMNCPIFSVDVPSGINAKTGEIFGVAVKATHTITFAAAKCGHYLLPAKEYVGRLHVMDIGITQEFINRANPAILANNESLWSLPETTLSGHKYTRGYVLVQGGEFVSSGAAKLAGMAALKIGSGLSSIICSDKTLPIYAASLTSVMTKLANNADELYKLVNSEKVTSLLIGPGAGLSDETAKRTLQMLETKKPCVVDADALSVFSQTPNMLFDATNENTVLTPHAGEFRRIFGEAKNKLEAVQNAITRFKGVLVYKGNDTIIAQAQKPIVINTNAPPSLATAGSGDVLAGMIAGLMANGMAAYEAALAGVFYHSQTALKLGRNFTSDEIISALKLP